MTRERDAGAAANRDDFVMHTYLFFLILVIY